MSFMRNTPALPPALPRTAASLALGGAEDGDEESGGAETDSISPASRRIRRAHPELSSDELREARSLFLSADRDGNGVLDLAEFTSLMRQLQEKPPSPAHRRRAGLASPPLRNTVFTDDEIEMLFRRADVDRSGAIDPEEFITMQLKQRAAHAVAAFARLALGGVRTEEEEDSNRVSSAAMGGVSGGEGGGAAQSDCALHLGVHSSAAPASSSSSSAAAAAAAAAALPSSPPKAATAARSVTFHQAHFETQVADGSPKKRSPLRRNSTAPNLSQASREHDDETWSVAAADERYRELMRLRAVESALKAPRPDVSEVELAMLEALFKNADANEDGIVDFDEFVALMGKLSETTGKRYNSLQLRALFRVADLDRSGSIDFNEFIHAQRRVRSSMGDAKTTTMLSTVVGRLGWVWKGRKSESSPPPDA
jgi:Ca2+-binding EF-hand superfamily protein